MTIWGFLGKLRNFAEPAPANCGSTFEPHPEELEQRIAPALLVSVAGDTLKIDATDSAAYLYVEADLNDPSRFTVAADGDIINGGLDSLSFQGINNIELKMGAETDGVEIGNSTHFTLNGSLKITAYSGAAYVEIQNGDIRKDVTISMKSHSSESSLQAVLLDVDVGGNVIVRSQQGEVNASIKSSEGEWHRVEGSVKAQSNKGDGYLAVSNVDVGGDVSVKAKPSKGLGSAGLSVLNEFSSNEENSDERRPVVEGDVKLNYSGRNLAGLQLTAEVQGDVIFSASKAISSISLSSDFLKSSLGGDVSLVAGDLKVRGNSGADIAGDLQVRGDDVDLWLLSSEISGKTSMTSKGAGSFEVAATNFAGAVSIRIDGEIGRVGFSNTLANETVRIKLSDYDDRVFFDDYPSDGAAIFKKDLILNLGKGSNTVGGPQFEYNGEPSLIIGGDFVLSIPEVIWFVPAFISFPEGGAIKWT
jgi:hypothetical protein